MKTEVLIVRGRGPLKECEIRESAGRVLSVAPKRPVAKRPVARRPAPVSDAEHARRLNEIDKLYGLRR